MRLHRTLIVLAAVLGVLSLLAVPTVLSAQVQPGPVDGATAPAVDAPAVDSPGVDPQIAPPPATSDQRIRVLLSGYEFFPTRDDLLAVSPVASAILIAIYEDEDALPTMRSRAIDALGYFNDDLTSTFFASLLERHASIDKRHLHHALTAYAKAFGTLSVEREAIFLEHEDAQIRLTTVTALDEFGGRPALELLKKRVTIEKSPLVLKKLEQVRF